MTALATWLPHVEPAIFLENLFVQVNHALGNLNLDYFFKLVHITPAMHFVHHLVRPEVKVD